MVLIYYTFIIIIIYATLINLDYLDDTSVLRPVVSIPAGISNLTSLINLKQIGCIYT